jgi:hypothetical protein
MICAADAMCKFPSGEKQNAGGAWQLDRRLLKEVFLIPVSHGAASVFL